MVKQEIEAAFDCKLCKDRVNRSLSELRSHYKSMHKGKRFPRGARASFVQYTCDICGRSFKTALSFERHMDTHNNQLDCKICDLDYKNAFYIKHLQIHSEEQLFKCVYCEYSTANLSDITPHLRVHEGKYKYTCAICDQGFHFPEWFEEHANYHSGLKPFGCEICGQTFLYSRHLSCHKRRIHKEMITYECKVCKRKAVTKRELRKHMIVHNFKNKTPVLCEICGKETTSNEMLKFHLRIHTGDKPYPCKFCGKAFTLKNRLQEHERVHTGERPFVCKFCAKGFTQRSSLRIHERTHTGERPYVCRFCSKGYISKGAMDIHMKNCQG